MGDGLHRDPEGTRGARDGAWDNITFDAYTDAKRFKALVEVHSHQWPPAEILIAQGSAFLMPGAVVTPVAPVVTFEAFALEYVERLMPARRRGAGSQPPFDLMLQVNVDERLCVWNRSVLGCRSASRNGLNNRCTS
jgi:hypothetical protein